MIAEVQQLLTDYSNWLRERTRLQSIDEHVEITTPYLDRHNDYLQIYVRRSDGGYVLTDDGYVIDDLRTAGCEITTPKRRQILEAVLNGFGVNVVGEALQVDATQNNFALRKHNLVQAMLAISDMFYLAQPSVAAIFSEDVSDWLRTEDVRYTPNIRFSGRSGLDHHFDFVIPASQQHPERIVQTINHPDRNSAEIVAFAWMDTRQTRPSGSTAFAVLNDRSRQVSPGIRDALQRYEVTPVLWSERSEFVTVLRD